MRKYTDEYLLEIAKHSKNMLDMMTKMGFRATSGSMQNHLKQRLLNAKADLSHWVKGNTGKISGSRLPRTDVFIKIPRTCLRRQRTTVLRRAMLEIGISYKCSICSISEWNSKKLTLQIDHVDGDWRNNEICNLRFLCPNCHTQTETWGRSMAHDAIGIAAPLSTE
jgi:hypothetical protein